jgi:hypothetical protein
MIVGKVAQIIDESLIVLNVGSNNGVSVGMRFSVFEEGEKVLDPSTGVALENVEHVKGTIEIVHVQEKIAQATGKSDEYTGSKTLSEKMVQENINFGVGKQLNKMNVVRDQMAGRRSGGPIKVGDGIRQLIESEASTGDSE